MLSHPVLFEFHRHSEFKEVKVGSWYKTPAIFLEFFGQVILYKGFFSKAGHFYSYLDNNSIFFRNSTILSEFSFSIKSSIVELNISATVISSSTSNFAIEKFT